MLLMGLRLTEGIDAARFAARTGMALEEALDPEMLDRAMEENYLRRDNGRLRATAEGRSGSMRCWPRWLRRKIIPRTAGSATAPAAPPSPR